MSRGPAAEQRCSFMPLHSWWRSRRDNPWRVATRSCKARDRSGKLGGCPTGSAFVRRRRRAPSRGHFGNLVVTQQSSSQHLFRSQRRVGPARRGYARQQADGRTQTYRRRGTHAIRAVLGAVTIRRRTGELGITHGLERFVSTHVVVERRLLQNRKLDRGEPRALRGTAREGKASSA
jgi:hypothetical protein